MQCCCLQRIGELWRRCGGGFLLAWTVLSLAASAAPAADTVILSEFVASNSGGLRDEDGDASDWIELFNAGTSTVNLGGWSLTDSPGDLTKWSFPSTNLAPGAFLVVFASGKNRRVPGAPLHTGFSLSASGEYLALVRPDGTVASEFVPAYPEQFPNVSYGLGQNLLVTTLLSGAATGSFWIPGDGALGTNWVAPLFDDSAWPRATNGVGYENAVPGFAVRNIRANVGVCDLGTADAVLSTPSMQAAVFAQTRSVANFVNTGSGANFGGDTTFPGFTINVDEDNFVTEVSGVVTIPTSGN